MAFTVVTREAFYHKRPCTGVEYFHSGACFSRKLTTAKINAIGWDQELLTNTAASVAYKSYLKRALDNP